MSPSLNFSGKKHFFQNIASMFINNPSSRVFNKTPINTFQKCRLMHHQEPIASGRLRIDFPPFFPLVYKSTNQKIGAKILTTFPKCLNATLQNGTTSIT